MFTWLGSQLDTLLGGYVLGVVSALASALAPLALTVFTLWVLLFGWAVLRNEVPETLPTFLWKVVRIGFVFAFALQAGFYVGNVADTANGLAMGVASTFVPAGADPAVVSSPYALLDQFNDRASEQVSDIMKEASIFRLDLLFAAGVFSIGSVVFLCITLFVVSLSKVFLTFVIAVGPLFILCLAWRPTQRFFDSWLSMLLNAVVLTWFAFFALGISTFAGNQIFLAINSGGGFLGEAFNVLSEATRYCIVMILMGIVCFQAPGLAAALTGGAAVQQGVHMLQNVLMVAGLRSVAASRGAAPAALANTVRAGGGLAYTAGRAASSAARALRAPAGQAAPRLPAYRLAAQRGAA